MNNFALDMIRALIKIAFLSVILACVQPSAAAEDTEKARVCAFVWPSCHDDSLAHELLWPEGNGEWEIIKAATPRFEGHYQPKRPLLGYLHDDDPAVIEQWIEMATAHGVNTFVYDWYWFRNRPFLEDALNKGFLGASSNKKMDFYIMWANHDVKTNYWNCYRNPSDESLMFNGDVTPEQFDTITDRVIEKYFHRSNYARIDGKPVFMIYDVGQFLETFGGDEGKAAQALAGFRAKCTKSGLKGLYLQCSIWPDAIYKDKKYAEDMGKLISALGFDGVATYNMAGRDVDYSVFCEKGVKAWDLWKELVPGLDYFPTVSIGYDDTPRYPKKGQSDVVQYNHTPEVFKATLNKAKDYASKNSKNIVYINAWNEWVEDSYLLPDEVYGYSYLNAVKDVFGPFIKDSLAVGETLKVYFTPPLPNS